MKSAAKRYQPDSLSDQYQHHLYPSSRKRPLHEVMCPRDMGEERKKARKKQGFLTRKAPEEPTGIAREERLFACPFRKRDPARYGTKAWKACIGPGWKISRLKEHIYRKHYAPGYRCDRCLSRFESRFDLHGHSRSDPPCRKREFDADSDVIDDAQKVRIQKKLRGTSDEQKWNEIYRVIFELGLATEIPSPYCDLPTAQPDGADILAEFENWLRRRAGSGGQQNSPQLKDFLDLLQCFRSERTGEKSVAVPDTLTLVHGCSGDATRIPESQELPSLEFTNDNITVGHPEGTDLLNTGASSTAPFGDMFSSDMMSSSDESYGLPDFDQGANNTPWPDGRLI